MSFGGIDIVYELEEKTNQVMNDESFGDEEERHRILGKYIALYFADPDIQEILHSEGEWL